MLYGISQVVCYIAWDTVNQIGKTGDSGNHTLRWIKNGTASSPTNSPTEVDSTNCKGVYKLTLTAAECEAYTGCLTVQSATSGIVIMPQTFTFEQLPDAAPNASGGLLTVGTSAGQINPDGSGKLDVGLINGSSTAAARLSAMFAATRLITVDDATFSPTTTVFETDQTVDDAQRYTEQVLFGLDGNNTGVTVPVTAYAFANSKVKLTVELLPVAPSDGHRFLIMGRIEQ